MLQKAAGEVPGTSYSVEDRINQICPVDQAFHGMGYASGLQERGGIDNHAFILALRLEYEIGRKKSVFGNRQPVSPLLCPFHQRSLNARIVGDGNMMDPLFNA